MRPIRVMIVCIALLMGGWLAFDGTRALTTGDYTTAKNGPYAGQLGPWSRVVAALRLNPRGNLIKFLHVALGVLWLVAMIAFVLQPTLGWWALLGSAILSLWYLPFGTVLGLIELGLLFLPQIRSLR